MNVFDKILHEESQATHRLGNPLGIDSNASAIRMVRMAQMTGGNGFRVPPAEPKIDRNGKTRAERKSEIRALAHAKYHKPQPIKYMHSSARKRAA